MPFSRKYLQTILIAFVILLSARTATAQNALPDSIIKRIPELTRNPPLHPDSAYQRCLSCAHFGLESEVGQDWYYATYALLLKKKNTGPTAAHRRDTLTRIFMTINSIYQQLEGGGTFFGHQYQRIPGYVEYAIFSCPKSPRQKGPKNTFIAALRRLILHEVQNNNDQFLLPAQKQTARQRLLHQTDKLAQLANNSFYLKQAIDFKQKYRMPD